jgi:hypothetical protein
LEFVGSFIQEILAVLGYAIVFAGAYKLFQIATDIREIKEAVKSGRRLQEHVGAPGAMKAPTRDTDSSLDSADSYAENLLRAVNAQSYPANAPVESGAPRP